MALGGSTTPSSLALTPEKIRRAYGFDRISGDGRGQTIAIITGADDTKMEDNLRVFDNYYQLPHPPQFRRVDAYGGTNFPPMNTSCGTCTWEVNMDIQWAHAIAPAANILVVVVGTWGIRDLALGADYARRQPDVSVISISAGTSEFASESKVLPCFVKPKNNAGVTFVASSGDSGEIPQVPAGYPTVLSAGGTYLSVDTAGNYKSELAWNYAGGGVSLYIPMPPYQLSTVPQTAQYQQNTIYYPNNLKRAIPDVAFVASPSSGAAVYDRSGWIRGAGTSLAAPITAGMIALANQIRVTQPAPLPRLDGYRDVLPMLYEAGGTYYHDLVAGAGARSAKGYDISTGLGSPKADELVNYLVKQPMKNVVGTLPDPETCPYKSTPTP